MSTIFLLMLSNVFMAVAWYGHLKYGHDWPLWKAVLVSRAIALFEYCLAVPANRLGFFHFSGFQLKIIQEVITNSVWTGSIETRSSCAEIWGVPFSNSSGSRVRDCWWEA